MFTVLLRHAKPIASQQQIQLIINFPNESVKQTKAL